jgi:hypothetical protein
VNTVVGQISPASLSVGRHREGFDVRCQLATIAIPEMAIRPIAAVGASKSRHLVDRNQFAFFAAGVTRWVAAAAVPVLIGLDEKLQRREILQGAVLV